MATNSPTPTDPIDVPFEQRTYEMVRDHYYRQFPLLKVYEDLTRRHNSNPDHSINEPWRGGLSTLEITKRALIEVGKPARDDEDVQHAEAYIRQLQDQMRSEYPEKPDTLASAIIGAEFQWAGCVSTAESFTDMDDAAKRDHVDSLVDELAHQGNLRDHLREALLIALPEIYARITADDEARRRRGGLRAVREADTR